MSENLSPHQKQLQSNARQGLRTVAGMQAAGLYIAGPALVMAAIGAAFGEGNYFLLIMAMLYGGLFLYGNSVRRKAEKGSLRRSLGFWIAVWSFMTGFICAAMAFTFFLSGELR